VRTLSVVLGRGGGWKDTAIRYVARACSRLPTANPLMFLRQGANYFCLTDPQWQSTLGCYSNFEQAWWTAYSTTVISSGFTYMTTEWDSGRDINACSIQGRFQPSDQVISATSLGHNTNGLLTNTEPAKF